MTTEALDRECPNARHGWRGFALVYSSWERDPECQTCTVRAMLAEHDHLHLGTDDGPCTTPGIGDTPGVNVKCRCGSFHH